MSAYAFTDGAQLGHENLLQLWLSLPSVREELGQEESKATREKVSPGDIFEFLNLAELS